MGKEDTLIRVKKDTWKMLNALKEPGDTFDDVLSRLLVAEHSIVKEAEELDKEYQRMIGLK